MMSSAYLIIKYLNNSYMCILEYLFKKEKEPEYVPAYKICPLCHNIIYMTKKTDFEIHYYSCKGYSKY